MQKEEGDNERGDGIRGKDSGGDEKLMHEENQSMHMRGFGDRKLLGAYDIPSRVYPHVGGEKIPFGGFTNPLRGGGVKVRIKRKFVIERIGRVLCGIPSRVYTHAVGGMVLGMRGRCMKRASWCIRAPVYHLIRGPFFD